jgi:hypothetical protein
MIPYIMENNPKTPEHESRTKTTCTGFFKVHCSSCHTHDLSLPTANPPKVPIHNPINALESLKPGKIDKPHC